MKPKRARALGSGALLTIFTTAAVADAITFTSWATSGTVTTVANQFGSPSLTGGPVSGEVAVKDTNTSLTLFLPWGSTGMIQSDNSTSYSAGTTTLVATYAGTNVLEVQVLSGYCPGGICLSGPHNFGT